MPYEMTPPKFLTKWRNVKLPERAASQEHFIDLCRMLGQPTPAEHDQTGAEYTFEKGVAVSGPASAGSKGEYGYADVWWRGRFAWEYKRRGKHKSLAKAYAQLCQYREALENPPLLIVGDIARIEIHTNFTGTKKEIHTIALEDITEPASLDLLRRVFTDPESFRPQVTAASVTEQVAANIGEVARELRAAGHESHETAHFLMKCMFCLFAEDVDLLPKDLFRTLLEQFRTEPIDLKERMTALFAKMRDGGHFGTHKIAYFNGGLFDDEPALELSVDAASVMLHAAAQDWSAVEPAIFGTLFERSLDPNKRAQIGAHYTSRDDIMLIVEPVVMAPLRREWEQVRTDVAELLERRTKAKTAETKRKHTKAVEAKIQDFVHRLATVRILDPACGSGNFLYVAIQQLLDLEKRVITFAARREIGLGLFPQVRPTELAGIEINAYAAELAQVVIWIGYLQWMRDNGYLDGISRPILEPLQTIECRDAILDLTIPTKPQPATWPEADFIIGNPPFLGSRFFRSHGLSDECVRALHMAYDIPNGSDLCCYWFELGRRSLSNSPDARVGLLATQGIRGQTNREVMDRIVHECRIFWAIGDRNWFLDGASVHVSIICFARQAPEQAFLDQLPVACINSDLTAEVDLTKTLTIESQTGICSRGSQKRGAFDVDLAVAQHWLATPNPNGRHSADVLFPWVNGRDIAQRPRGRWVIDFGIDSTIEFACQFERPFEYVVKKIKPTRDSNNDRRLRDRWWQHGIMQADMRERTLRLSRVVVSPRVSKHRLFAWSSAPTLPDDQLIVFGRDDYFFLGVLHSSIHELWARRKGSQLREAESGFRYTPTTCFETFPLPWPPGQENTQHIAHLRISEAARELNEQRERWLNPPEWIEPLAERVDAEDDFADVPGEARALIRHSAIMAAAAKDARLKRRTLTNLYNERPTWLRLGHEKLDRAVLAAYAGVDAEGEWAEDWAEVWVETGAGRALPGEDTARRAVAPGDAKDTAHRAVAPGKGPSLGDEPSVPDGGEVAGHPLGERRKEIDQRVLGNLLRMNLARSGADDGR